MAWAKARGIVKMNRKLIRPNLADIKPKTSNTAETAAEAPRSGGAPRRRPAPAESTNAEAFYYLKQMNTQTPVVIVLDNGEQLRGHIEWYDRTCLKVHRPDGPNLLLFKHCIRYLYKAEDEEILEGE
jgi:sRNA-binding regulator protein Hfq